MTKKILRKHYVILFVWLIILFSSVYFMYQHITNIQKKEKEVISINEELLSYEENKKIYAQESRSIEIINEKIKKIESYLITPETTPAFLSSIENLAKLNNVDFSITSVQTPEAGTEKQKLLIDFLAKGSEKNLDLFLKAMSHQTYQIKFNKLSFASSAQLNEQSVFDEINKNDEWEVLASIQVISF